MVYYYIEKDGRVFLTEHNGKLIFPTDKKDVPFEIKELNKMPFDGVDVIYCESLIPFPEHWRTKDDVIEIPNVDRIVLKSIYKSRPMLAAEGITVKNGKILSVKPNRGWGKGLWKLPAGVVGYRETPEQCIKREFKEETNLDVTKMKLIGISKKTFKTNESWFICFTFLCEVEGEIKAAPDEIEEVKWLEPQEILDSTENPFVKYGINKYLKEDFEVRIADLDLTN